MEDLNNSILTDKHFYASTLFSINELKKDIDLKRAKDEISEKQSQEILVIWNYLFAGLIREGLKYDYISTKDSNRDIIRITMDNIQFDCYASDLKKIFKEEYDEFINPERCNFKIAQNEISLMSVNTGEHTEKELLLENELKELKEKTSKQIKELQYTINHDGATGLKNKKAYIEAISTLKPPYTLISVDVNNLKETNDNYGHQAGDILLKNIAKALTVYFKHMCYRTGGDEFAIITTEQNHKVLEDNLNKATLLLQKIQDGLVYSFSYGYAFHTEAQNANEVFKLADKRMYQNKIEYKQQNNIPPRRGPEIERKEQEVIEYNTKDEKMKNIDSFIFDVYELTLIPPGGSVGDKIKAIVAPLNVYENNGHAPIVAIMLNKMGEYQTFISKNQPSLQVKFGEDEYLIRGMFVDGMFSSQIMLSGATMAMNYNLNKDNCIEYRSIMPEKTNYGHVVLTHEGRKFHIIPLANQNDKNGVAQCLVGVEEPDGTRFATHTNFSGYTTFKFENGTVYQLLTYWQDDILCAEIIPERK